MSMYDIEIPYPAPFDHDAARHEERRRRALKTLTVADVLAELDTLVASEPDATQHPCAGLSAWLLDQAWACDGGQLFDRWKALTLTAIDRLVEARLQEGD
jgi:hypothetical protein